MLSKIFRKIQTDGLFQTLRSAFLRVYFIYLKASFKSRSKTFFKIDKQSEKLHSFDHLWVKPLFLQLTNSEETYSKRVDKISRNLLTILSEKEIDFSHPENSQKIQWNVDLVENKNWPMDVWGVDIPIITGQGDVKRPWELGRLHFLVELAVIWNSTKSNGLKSKIEEQYTRILNDFSSAHPAFNGPQWMCAMDVGIRLSNIILSFRLLPLHFQKNLGSLVQKEILRHLFFIENNLEKGLGRHKNNHYLGNLAGLIYGFLTLGTTDEAKAFELLEDLEDEIQEQFLQDGGCFEGSTMYHRLSLELVFYPLLFILERFPQFKLQQKTLQKLKSAFVFSNVITDFEGQVLQVGDNDSGHLFIFDYDQYTENDLEQSRIQNMLYHFFYQLKEERNLDIQFVLQASLDPKISFAVQKTGEPDSLLFNELFLESSLKNTVSLVDKPLILTEPDRQKCIYELKDESLDFSKARFYQFPKFGLYIVKSEKFFLSVRSGHHQEDPYRGHEHFDQLSFQLKTEKGVRILDAGSGLYTSQPEIRNKFRGPQIHQVPYVESAQNRFSAKGLFQLPDLKGQCELFSREGFKGTYEFNQTKLTRELKWQEGKIVVTDSVQGTSEPLVALDFKTNSFSKRYGVISSEK